MKILALIPARGGSQRVKNKNIRELDGKPLIAYTFEAVKKSNYINRVVLTTDCEKIAELGRLNGIEVPFLRPPELSTGSSTEFEFHKHAIDWLKEHDSYIPDLIVNLYPTSPFRTVESIDQAIEKLLKDPEADSLRSVVKCSEHPYKMWVKKGDLLRPFVETDDGASHTLSYQLLPEVFIQNACIYITRPQTLDKYQNTVGERVVSFVMDEIESIDINNEIDFRLAETYLKR